MLKTLDWIPEEDRDIIAEEIAKHIYQSNEEKLKVSKKEVSHDASENNVNIKYTAGIVSEFTSNDSLTVKGENNIYKVESGIGSTTYTISCKKGKKTCEDTISPSDQKVLNEAVGNYCHAMAKLNTEAWIDVMIKCVDTSGNLSIKKIKNLAEDVLNDKCSEEVKKYIPGGDKIIEIIYGYKKLKNEYAEINNLITDTDDNSYANFEKTLGMLNNMLNKLN